MWESAVCLEAAQGADRDPDAVEALLASLFEELKSTSVTEQNKKWIKPVLLKFTDYCAARNQVLVIPALSLCVSYSFANRWSAWRCCWGSWLQIRFKAPMLRFSSTCCWRRTRARRGRRWSEPHPCLIHRLCSCWLASCFKKMRQRVGSRACACWSAPGASTRLPRQLECSAMCISTDGRESRPTSEQVKFHPFFFFVLFV